MTGTGTGLVTEIMREVNDLPPFSYTYAVRPDDLLEVRASELEAILLATIPTPDEWTLTMQVELEQARKQVTLLDQANVTLSAQNTELEEARDTWERWAKEMERRVDLMSTENAHMRGNLAAKDQEIVVAYHEQKRLRRELHRARIGFSVAIAMLPPERVDACAAEIERQVGEPMTSI